MQYVFMALIFTTLMAIAFLNNWRTIMGARQRIEAHQLALKTEMNAKLNNEMSILQACVEQAEEEHLPSATGLKAIQTVLKVLLEERHYA